MPQLTVTVVDYTGSSNVSDAGEAILEVVKAAEALAGSQSSLDDYKDETTRMRASIDARAAQLQENMEAALPGDGCPLDEPVDGDATDTEPEPTNGRSLRCRIERLRAQIDGAQEATKELFDGWYDRVRAGFYRQVANKLDQRHPHELHRVRRCCV